MNFILVEPSREYQGDECCPVQVDTLEQIEKAIAAMRRNNMKSAKVWTSPVEGDVFEASEHPECYENGQQLFCD